MGESDGNLIVNYLPQSVTDGELYSMFVTIGPIKSCRVMKDFNTNYSFGFGFVNYCNRRDAEKAIQQLNGLEMMDKKLKVSFARPSAEGIKETNLYITNLPRNFTPDDLKALCEPYGEIIQSNLLKDKLTGMMRGVAFVRYNKKEEAQNAIKNLNGKPVNGSIECVSVRVAEEHGKQKAAYYAGWQAGLHQSFGHRPVNHFASGFRGRQGSNLLFRQQRFDPPMNSSLVSKRSMGTEYPVRRVHNFNRCYSPYFVRSTRGEQENTLVNPKILGFSSFNSAGGC